MKSPPLQMLVGGRTNKISLKNYNLGMKLVMYLFSLD